MRKKSIVIGIAGICTLLGFTAIASAEDVKVGVILPLTGSMASTIGVPPSKGLQIALDEIKSTKMIGDGRTLSAVIQDDASEKSQDIALVNSLISRDNVSMIIGPSSSTLASVGAPIANQLKTPILTLAVSEVVTRTGPYVFKIYPGPNQVILPLAKYLIEKEKIKTLIIVTARDNEAMMAYGRVMHDYALSHGVKIVDEDTVLNTDTDFTGLATKVAGVKADAMFLSMVPEAAANFVIQAKQAGLSPSVKLVGHDSIGTLSYTRIGGSAVDGTIFPIYYFSGNKSAMNTRFVAEYRKKYNSEPDAFSAIGYSVMMVAATAIKNAGPNATRDQIRDALAKIQNIPTILGEGLLSFDANRNPTYNSTIMMISNGKFVPAKN